MASVLSNCCSYWIFIIMKLVVVTFAECSLFCRRVFSSFNIGIIVCLYDWRRITSEQHAEVDDKFNVGFGVSDGVQYLNNVAKGFIRLCNQV